MYMDDFHKLEKIPPGPHLFCPKIDDNDAEDYDDAEEPQEPGEITAAEKQQRIDEGKARAHVAYRLSYLLFFPERTTTWLNTWTKRVEECLTNCDHCVRNWHLGREPFLKATLEYVSLSLSLFLFLFSSKHNKRTGGGRRGRVEG